MKFENKSIKDNCIDILLCISLFVIFMSGFMLPFVICGDTIKYVYDFMSTATLITCSLMAITSVVLYLNRNN